MITELPTDEQVEFYLRSKLAEALTYFDYCALTLEVRAYRDSKKPSVEITCYINPAIGTIHGKCLPDAIAKTLQLMAEKSEAQILREKAGDLIAQAEKLEAKQLETTPQ